MILPFPTTECVFEMNSIEPSVNSSVDSESICRYPTSLCESITQKGISVRITVKSVATDIEEFQIFEATQIGERPCAQK